MKEGVVLCEKPRRYVIASPRRAAAISFVMSKKVIAWFEIASLSLGDALRRAMTEFDLMFSKKYKTVNWGDTEWGYLKKQSQLSRTEYCVLLRSPADLRNAVLRQRNLKKQSQFLRS